MASIEKGKKVHNRVKMSVPDMGFKVLEDNERIIAMIEKQEKRRLRIFNFYLFLWVIILLFTLILGIFK